MRRDVGLEPVQQNSGWVGGPIRSRRFESRSSAPIKVNQIQEATVTHVTF